MADARPPRATVISVSRATASPQYVAVVDRLRAAGSVFAEEEARLLVTEARSPDDLEAMVARRVAGLPLEHVLGWVEFCGLRIAVDAGVFVPRRRTELLVDEAVRCARRAAEDAGEAGTRRPPVVVDLCCGSGAVAAAVVDRMRPMAVELHAVDVEPAAVRCAHRNLPGGRVYEGDLSAPLPVDLRGRVDVLVANAPYVPTGAVGLMPPEARTHEPRVALDGGPDGLSVVRRVLAEAPRWLTPGGVVLVESSEGQAPVAVEAVVATGLTPRISRSDELDATVVLGTRPA